MDNYEGYTKEELKKKLRESKQYISELESNCNPSQSDKLSTGINIPDNKALHETFGIGDLRFKNAIEASPVPYALNDDKQNIVYLNQAFISTFGYQIEDIPTLEDWWPKAYPDSEYRQWVSTRWQQHFDKAKLHGSPFEPLELDIRCKDGSVRTVLASAASLSLSFSGTHLVILYDITKRKQVEDELNSALGMLENVINSTPDLIFVKDNQLKTILCNKAYADAVGMIPEDMYGYTDIENGWDPDLVMGNPEKGTRGFIHDDQDALKGLDIHNPNDPANVGDEVRIFDTHKMPLRNLDGSIIGVLGVARDITERKKSEEKAEFLAYHDSLTKLPNRLLVKDRMNGAIARTARHNSEIALLFLDLDDFKTINNSLGHPVGDALLIAVTQRLKECCRETDTISRQGGDEFLILLEDIHHADDIVNISRNILTCLELPFFIHGHHLAITLSIGISVYPKDGKTFDILLKRADTAMYQSKHNGKNTFCFYTEQMNLDAIEHLNVRIGLKRALENSEFVLHYQPQIELSSGRVIGAEALIRWNNPEQGMIAPDRFIQIAEDSGLIVPIGKWVIEEACRQASIWHKAGYPDLIIAINLSSVQFQRGNLESNVSDALQKFDMNPNCLELELTESILMKNTESVLGVINRLKSMGLKLSIDDFGTGYSSLSYLKRFAVDKLKIDRSFVSNMVNDPNDSAIVHAIIQMAKSLNLTTIAEGVEERSTLNELLGHQCDEVQGYYFSRPLPADEFFAYLSKNQKNNLL